MKYESPQLRYLCFQIEDMMASPEGSNPSGGGIFDTGDSDDCIPNDGWVPLF